MKTNVTITREQVLFLTLIGIIGNIVYCHTWIDNDTDRAAWVACLLGIFLITPFAVWILFLGKYQPHSTVIDMIETGLGKFSLWIIGILYIFTNIAVAAAQLNMFTEMMNVFFLPFTPPWIIMLTIILLCTIFVNSEIVTFGRTVEILGAFALINYFFSFIFALPNEFHLYYVLPVFDTSFGGLLKGTLFIMGSASECLLLLIIIVKFIPDSEKHYSWVIKGIGLSAVIFAVAVMVIMGTMSPELAKRISFGGVNAAKLIQIGEFLRGLEVLICGSYQYIALGKISVCLYCIWTTAKKMMNNKKSGLLLLLSAFIILAASMWITSYNKAYFLGVFLGSYILLPFSVFVLLVASLSIKIKNKKSGSV